MASSIDYAETLKKIKESEVETARELAERKKAHEGDLRTLEEESAHSIEEAKQEAEALEAKMVEAARSSAQAEAEKLLISVSGQVRAVAGRRLTKKELEKILQDVLLSEFREE